MTYWDPIPAVRALVGTLHPMWQDGVVRHDWSGPAPDGWTNRDWRNVPGPFYTAGTDNCFTGRRCAPEHVAYEDEYCTEFVYRQQGRIEHPDSTYQIRSNRTHSIQMSDVLTTERYCNIT
ncbi:hypothetical protein OG401_03880 [Kitasatospora purpeofusca]|uniref:hypothetical protein n=1 Tax=Kitasatospora purpeofusca TaxID=67352 RepID=UPI00224FF59B|nr:hypothetical protein [Kitasatospora purpeofusca]MCX4683452.1 hypothetical protein [Kitasatospora purpeofusca]